MQINKKNITLWVTLLLVSNAQSIDYIAPQDNAHQKLIASGLTSPSGILRLHLGCGEQHISGYINIDFPPDNHTVQNKVAANIFADITALRFPTYTIDEVKSHHTFEHFDRQTALAMVCAWNWWLKPNGTLIIETPDFQESIKQLVSTNYSYNQKQAILRHIFGSHEAHWALHYDGWYEEKFRHVLTQLGFNIISVHKTAWGVTRNLTITAQKNNTPHEQVTKNAYAILRESTIDSSSSEIDMWKTWCNLFDNAYEKMIYHGK